MDQNTLFSLLEAAFARVRAKGSDFAGVDRVTHAKWAADLEQNTQALAAALATGQWRPSRLQRVRLKKADGRRRLLGLPTLADRMVIDLLRQVLEPRVEALLGENVLAYRPRRGTRQAMTRLEETLRGGASWVGLADIHEFFDHIRLDRLWPRVEALLARHPQGAFWGQLCRKLLHAHSAAPGRGLAQGSSLSPALSNLALVGVDQGLARAGFSWMRYSDDLCLLADSQARVQQGLELLTRELKPLGLRLGQERVTQAREGFLWLGFWVTHQGRSVSQGALEALRQRSQRLHQRYQGEELSLRLETLVRGWRNYYDAPLPRGFKLEPHEHALQELLGLEGPPLPEEEDPIEDTQHSLLWGAGEEQDEVARLLDQVDALAARGHYAQAQELALRAQALQEEQPEPSPAPDPRGAPELELDQERAEVFLGLFCAGDVRCEWGTPGQEPGRREFSEIEGAVDLEQLYSHLTGEGALAVRPRDPGGLCSLGVIDIDAQSPDALPSAEAFAAALSYTAHSLGWTTLREDTGGRGVHLWFPLERAIQANLVAQALEWLVRRTGQPRDGIKVELLPGGDDAPELHQQAMTLPLGVHLETGQRSRLYDPQGREVTPDLLGIFSVQPTAPELLRGCLRPEPSQQAGAGAGLRPSWTPEQSGPQVKRVMEGCAVLRHLADKAATVGHLDHGERLSLLFSLGHLGKPGQRALHHIIGACSNYDVIETNRQIAKLSGLPIGCSRMRQKHAGGELLAQCSCDFGDMGRRGGYPTPLLHAMGFRRDWKIALRGRPPSSPPTAPSAPANAAQLAAPGYPQRPAVDLREQISLQLRDPAQTPLPPPHTWA